MCNALTRRSKTCLKLKIKKLYLKWTLKNKKNTSASNFMSQNHKVHTQVNLFHKKSLVLHDKNCYVGDPETDFMRKTFHT